MSKFGKYNLAAFIIIVLGVVIYLVSPLTKEGIDLLGVLIFLIGLVMLVGGFAVRKVGGNKGAK